jgi:hypothetical protein
LNDSDRTAIDVIEHWLAGAKYYVKRGYITKAYWQIYYCCEVMDELIEAHNA